MLHQHHHEPQWLPSVLLATFQTYACHLLNVTVSPTLGGWLSPIFRPSLDKYLISASFFISDFWSLFITLFITRLIKVSQTPIFLHIPMKSVPIGLVFAEDRRDQLTWKILTDHTKKVLIWSSVCSTTHTSTNKRLTLPHGEGQKTDLTSNSFVYDMTLPHENSGLMPTLNFDDYLGRTFLLPALENWEWKQAHIVEHVTHLEESQVA